MKSSEFIIRQLEEKKLTLPVLKSILPRELSLISEKKSLFTFVTFSCLLLISLFLENKTNNLILLTIIWLFHAQIIVGFFVLGHECGHGRFSNKNWINITIGHLCFSILGNGFFTWKRTHNAHHQKTQLRGHDVDWSSFLVTEEEFKKLSWKNDFIKLLGLKLPFGIFVWVFWNALKRAFEKKTKTELISNLGMWFSLLGGYQFIIIKFGFWTLFKYHLIPATLAMFIGYFLLIIQHAQNECLWFDEKKWDYLHAQLASTYNIRFPKILEKLWLNINVHIPHHLFPEIPWHQLPVASEVLKNELGTCYQEKEFKFSDYRWLIRTPFIEKKDNYYFMKTDA